ncbi:hypothetical protein [Roseovarius sp. MMSF_3281]|uniref:hypothetical protein n=1 Tax=Roseovarius sp. MMSF_3281 TaxID=3046694 RepID=UPI00273E1168|nr:hypothetical protein [Roseovarius sp. MMSF_3281]
MTLKTTPKVGVTRRELMARSISVAFSASLGSARLSIRAYGLTGQTITVLTSQPRVGGAEIVAVAFTDETDVEITPVPLGQIQQQLTLNLQSGAKRFAAFNYWYISKDSPFETRILENQTHARSRTSGEYLFMVLLMILHPTQEL